MGLIRVPKIRDCRIRQEGEKVILVVDGKSYLELPWDAALQIGKAMQIQARKAEEIAKAQQIAFDQGVIIRSGFPVGLTNNPAIHKEAAKEAAHNKVLRKMPGGIKSQSSVGKPRVIKKQPTEEQRLKEERKHEQV